MDKMKKIEDIVETYMYEEDIEDETQEDPDTKIIKIFYSDLDMEGKRKVLEAIDAEYEYAKVFEDDIVKNNIIEALSKRPIVTLTAEELSNMMDIEL